jgi:hypothetical protein
MTRRGRTDRRSDPVPGHPRHFTNLYEGLLQIMTVLAE